MTELPKIIPRRREETKLPASIEYHPVLKAWREKHGYGDGIFPYQAPENISRDFLHMLAQSREVSAKQDTQTPSEGFRAPPGLTFDRRKKRWKVRIHYQNAYKFIGYFASYREAVAARKMAEELRAEGKL